MPALPPVSKVIRVDLLGALTGNPSARNRIFIQYAGTLSIADLTTWLGTVATKWGTRFNAILSSDFTLNNVLGTDLSSASAPQVAVSTTQTGTSAAAPLTGGSALVIRFKISRRYRGGHPRFYFGGLPGGMLSNSGLWIGANLTAFVNAFSGFITDIETAPPAAMGALTHVNVSYFAGFTNKTFPSGRVHPVATLRGSPTVDPIIAYSGNPLAASQRRRNRQSS
jgi:hypothetical protein